MVRIATLKAEDPSGPSQPLAPVFVATFDQRVDPEAVLATIEVRADGSPVEIRFNALPAIRPEVDPSIGPTPPARQPPPSPPMPPDYLPAPNPRPGIAGRPTSSFLGPAGTTSNITNAPVGSTIFGKPKPK